MTKGRTNQANWNNATGRKIKILRKVNEISLERMAEILGIDLRPIFRPPTPKIK